MAIIGISGKKQSGKDTVAKIIQHLTMPGYGDTRCPHWNFHFDEKGKSITDAHLTSSWKTVRFADKLKDIVCMLTGCTREQLEDEAFKNSELPDCWIRYRLHLKHNVSRGLQSHVGFTSESKANDYAENVSTYKRSGYTINRDILTYREVLQSIGTNLFRHKFHPNTWVNATMADYKPKVCSSVTHCALAGRPEISCWQCPEYPNWIIPDVRFINEVEAIKERGGIVIRVNRKSESERWKDIDTDGMHVHQHESEVALDYYHDFDVVINNNGNIESLVSAVSTFLEIKGIIKS